MNKLTYAEAVKLAGDWADILYERGIIGDGQKEALAVLRSVQPIVEAVMKIDQIDFEDLFSAALSLKERMEKAK